MTKQVTSCKICHTKIENGAKCETCKKTKNEKPMKKSKVIVEQTSFDFESKNRMGVKS